MSYPMISTCSEMTGRPIQGGPKKVSHYQMIKKIVLNRIKAST